MAADSSLDQRASVGPRASKTAQLRGPRACEASVFIVRLFIVVSASTVLELFLSKWFTTGAPYLPRHRVSFVCHPPDTSCSSATDPCPATDASVCSARSLRLEPACSQLSTEAWNAPRLHCRAGLTLSHAAHREQRLRRAIFSGFCFRCTTLRAWSVDIVAMVHRGTGARQGVLRDQKRSLGDGGSGSSPSRA